MTIVSVGIDTAKSIFAVHGVDTAGKVQLNDRRRANCWRNSRRFVWLDFGGSPCSWS
jgi:hypothetical protein